MSFFRGVTSGITGRSRDTILKASLINNLSECVKDIQFNNQSEEKFHSILGFDDSTNSLCMSLEAILLHGLKDTFFRKAKNALKGDTDERPQPSFWPLVLVLSHRENIDQISSLPQINTEIGQCRAWLRSALNDCLLSSYLSTLLRNIGAVKPFYNKWAFVCDAEILDVAQRLIEGLESCIQFNLPINSSLLNSWPEQVLIESGKWIPTMKVAPISAGVDIASTLTDDELKPEDNTTEENKVVKRGLERVLDLTEDDILRYILSKQPEKKEQMRKPNSEDDKVTDDEKVCEKLISTSPQTEKEEQLPSTSKVEPTGSHNEDSLATDSFSDLEDKSDFERTPHKDINFLRGNSLTGKTCWSTENNEELNTSLTSNSSHGSEFLKTPKSKSQTSLVDSSSLGGSYVHTPNLRDIMKGLHKELKLNVDDNSEAPNLPVETTTVDDGLLAGLGFEVVPNSLTSAFTVPELQKLVQQLGTLSREYGLDSQNYQCKACQDLLGSTISKAQVCAFSGEYFCSNCMDPNIFMVPARVIHNWDFKRYHVSKKAALFLLEFQQYPLIDMKKMNPKIYSGVDDMAQLQELRVQLNFLRAYIFTCREHVIEELQKRIWPREYLYEHLHQYSISDLAQIPNGSLALQLEKIVNFARNHVRECWLCSQKGFICEVCKDSSILYPFDTATTYRCSDCSSVFHAKCLNATIPCPKCKRQKQRKDPTLVEAVYKNFN